MHYKAVQPPERGARAPARILDAALAEFALHGIDGARVEEIVRRAAVSKQLFYYYFESKEEIYRLVLERACEQAVRSIIDYDYAAMLPECALKELMSRIFDQYIEMPFLVKFAADQDHHCGAHISARNKLRSQIPVVVSLVDTILKRGAAIGEFRADVDSAFFFAASLLVLRGCFVSSTTAALIPALGLGERGALYKWRANALKFILSTIRCSADFDPAKSVGPSAAASERTEHAYGARSTYPH